MVEEEPPSFEDSKSHLPPGYDSHATSAAAGSIRRLQERVYTLETSKKQPWAFLKVHARPGKATSLPLFFEGEPIMGTVELDLEKTEYIQLVTIEVRGESVTVGQEPLPFLTKKTTLWSTSMGDPGTVGSNSGIAKLKGKYVWPFSITLPDKVTFPVGDKSPASKYALPPSFSERTSPLYLHYILEVIFQRGKFRSDSNLSTSLGYMPRSQPAAPSALRQLAYRQNTAPPGPKADPEGWETLGTKSVVGTLFESRTVEVACSLCLARPLSYALGTSIPFALTLSCSDQQTLDLFVGRGALSIHLMRALRMGSDATDPTKPGRSNNTFIMDVGHGVYWPSEENIATSEVRKLEGEIPVRRDLRPSFVFPRVSMKYYVSFTLTAPGFTVTSGSGATDATFSRDVEITTTYAPGPAPRSRVPAADVKEQAGDFDISIGMLTAANQRFVHHHAFG